LLLRCLNRMNVSKSRHDREKLRISRLGKPFSEGGSFELFSSPYSNYRLHQHPLVKSADIINIHWTSGFLDIPSFFENVNKPVVWTLHDMNPYLGGFHYTMDLEINPQLAEVNNEYYNIKRKALGELNYSIIGNSKWSTENALKSDMFFNASLTETIYTPLHSNEFHAIEKIVAKKALRLPVEKFIIGFVSESIHNPRKGFKYLLEAIKLLPANYKKKVHCLIAGQCSNLKGAAGISFTHMGSVNNRHLLSIIYSAMDGFISPSLAEAFGLTTLEAMACKTPVIGFDTGGIPEMVVNSMTGLLAKAGNIESLSLKIAEMMDLTSSQRIVLGENAYNLVIQQHNPIKISKQYQEVYNSLLES
jgi:glycosyltransferase involved in cell wall biosynthesis